MLTATDPAPLTPAWATVFWASGAMRSSAADLARWGDALYAGDVLGDSIRTQMLSFNANGYGLGAQRIEIAGRVGVGHTGLLDTYTALLLYLPDADVTIALLVDRPEAPLGAMLTAQPAAGGPSLLELATGP
jgi:CubicO group peptidase (beta-lactamase class C family)